MKLSKSAMHMSSDKNYEVQRTNHFELVIDGLSDDVTLAVQSCPFPPSSNEVIELSYGNGKVKVAGQAVFDDIEIQLLDYIGRDTELELAEWRRQVYDPETDTIGFAEDYKRQGYVHQYAPNGSHVRSWKIKGVWPTTFNPGENNQEGSDKKLMSMTLSVDKATIVRD